MFGRLIKNIVEFFIRRKLIFFLVFAAISTVLILGLRNLKIEEDIYSIFPEGEEFQSFNEILQKTNLNKQLLFSVKTDQEDYFSVLDSIQILLEKKYSNEIQDVVVYREVDEKQLVEFLQSTSIIQIKQKEYDEIEAALTLDSIELKIKNTQERLSGSNGFFLKNLLRKDPLNITTKYLSKFNPLTDSSNFLMEDNLLYSSDKKFVIFTANLSLDLQATDQLVALKKSLDQDAEENGFDYFGSFLVAAENAIQVKKDTFLTLIISLALILLILVLYYRSILAPFYFILPALFGILCGLGIIGYIRPEISAISLATSSVLLGIVLDYSFHFFTHLKNSGDVKVTVKEVSTPMIVGSFTTIAALGALMFTNSVVLQDFGLVALCTLSGAVLFTLLFLPVILDTFKIKLKQEERSRKMFQPSKLFTRISLLGITAVTVFFLLKGVNFSFDGDLNHLSYHSEELIQKEKFYTGIHPKKNKKLFLIASGENEEETLLNNYKAKKLLDENSDELNIKELVSTAHYLLPKKIVEGSNDDWVNFWSTRKDSIESTIKNVGKDLDLSDQAFQPFFNWMDNPEIQSEEGVELLKDLGLSNFVYSDGSEKTILTSVFLDINEVDKAKNLFKNESGIYILDVADLTKAMLSSVQDDFNYLILFSTILVFFSLLIVYGRLELALFALFPMVLSWIWILGISNLVGLQFNFVNIVIVTFIFGLGDDFSIFVTDGLIQKFKIGVDKLAATKTAIFLSGLTTIIGTGILYFAKHPAVHSIGLISVLGIGSILLITLFIQPQIFHYFTINRTEKRKAPATLFTFIYSILLYTYFVIGSILLNIFLIFILIPFPAKKVKKRAFLNFLISKLAKSTLYAGFHVKKKIHNKEKLDFSKPKILVANHSSFLDILLVLMLHPKALIMVKSWVYNSPVFGLFIRYAGYPFAKEGTSDDLDSIQARINEGYSILIFPEGTRSIDGEIKRFHKGAFYLAQELNLELQPLLIIGAHQVNPKNDILITSGELHVVALDVFNSFDDETYSAYSKRCLSYMRENFRINKDAIAATEFWKPKILKNYLYKGPVLEWYVRIKWGLERKNFEYYDNLISNKKVIYDLGCGYGYLSYYLHYRNPQREIFAQDYDNEKIEVAQNCVSLSNSLQFNYGDIRNLKFRAADAVFVNDVLHYLPVEDQDKLLEDIVTNLNSDGILFIRDGIVENENQLKNTELTEKFSTRIFNFNKTTNQLTFLSKQKIKDFSLKHNLTFELIEHSKRTSNVLFVLRKN